MGIAVEYERDEWDNNGGWRGVEDYVDAVTLFFADDDVIDDHEETPETRSEVAYPDGRVEVKVTRHRCYRAFYREGPYTWRQEDAGERDFTGYYLTHRDTPAAPTPDGAIIIPDDPREQARIQREIILDSGVDFAEHYAGLVDDPTDDDDAPTPDGQEGGDDDVC